MPGLQRSSFAYWHTVIELSETKEMGECVLTK